MRLPGYILAELTVAATLVGVGTVGALYGVRHAQTTTASRSPTTSPASMPGARRDLSNLPDLRVALESSGTFMGMSDELLLERVRTQPIVRFKLNHGGSSLSFRVEFADGSRAAWKPNQTNMQTVPRKEIAAYRLNRLLGLNAVPPAAPRVVTRDELLARLHPDSLVALPRIKAETLFGSDGRTIGTASYWVPVIKDSGFDTPEGRQQGAIWLTQGQPVPPEKVHMAAQLSDLAVFDFLTANPDRYSGGNMKMSPDGKQLFYMDNTMAFYVDPNGFPRNREVLQRTQRFSRKLYASLEKINAPTLEKALSEEIGAPYEILTPAEIGAVMARREVIRNHVGALVAAFGERKVLVFP